MFDIISSQTGISPKQIEAVSTLLDDGATIPFIARYRKEATGSLDEVALTTIRDTIAHHKELTDRKAAILKSLEERALLTEPLKSAIDKASTATALEDLYQQYRPKKRTRAMIAREKGLEPLAKRMMNVATGQSPPKRSPRQEAAKFITDPAQAAQPPKGQQGASAEATANAVVLTEEEALFGARDIVAEMINEAPPVRNAMRRLFTREALLSSSVKRGKKEAGEKFKDYFEWAEPVQKAPSHRVLAMLRGVNEGILNLHALPPESSAVDEIHRYLFNSRSSQENQGDNASPNANAQIRKEWIEQLTSAVQDGYKRLLGPSMENELIKALKERADAAAIDVFTANMEELLLSAPLGQKAILAVDPGFRTGCKVVCLNRQGALLDHDVIFPMGSGGAAEKASKTVENLVKKHHIEAIAVGNGTAGRETEEFLRSLSLPSEIPVIMVDESGASIYSASQCARDEFPDHDITVRGAVSIGRRLMDPLAELVKIDPKSIGVGQYQHDVDQKKLQQSLEDVVTRCVNKVGVELNTASKELLCRVAGLNRTTAGNIVSHRDANGPFKTRKALLKVPRLGPKAFEQCAGFLRIHGGENPLDGSGIHPESYVIVEKMAQKMNAGNDEVTVKDLMGNKRLVDQIVLADYVDDRVGMPTLKDITHELLKPGRDPRERFKIFSFADHVHEITDLETGMKLPGIVTNVTAFGAFVDIGVHQDGLVHISQLADQFVKNPSDVVRVKQQVSVTVLDVDIKRKRISLSMRQQ